MNKMIVVGLASLVVLLASVVLPVAAQAEAPHWYWYSNGKLIPEGEEVLVETHGTLTFSHVVAEESEVTCTVTDKEVIENPVGGGAGVDHFKSLAFSSCYIPSGRGNAAVCGSGTPEVIAASLSGWSTQLVAGGSGPLDEIKGVDLELKCSGGSVLETLKGTLTPAVGSSVLTFTSYSGTLTQGSPYGGDITHVIGTDTLEGPKEDEHITAETPPHWYSNGKFIKEGEEVVVSTHGTLTFSHIVAEESEVTCTVTDKEVIENHIGGSAGVDSFKSLKFSSCYIPSGRGNAAVCGSGTPEVIVLSLSGWSTQLVAGGSGPVDEIKGVDLELKCSGGSVLEKLTGTLTPAVGDSELTFTTGSGTLAQGSPYSGDITHVIGTDTLEGPEGDEYITTEVPPHWYSNNELIREGEEVLVETHGTLTFSHVVAEESEVTCTVTDSEVIENPLGGRPGIDSFKSLKFSSCYIPSGRGNAAVCGSGTPEVIVLSLSGWSTQLVAGGSGPLDEIKGVDLELKCSGGSVLEKLTGTLTPAVGDSELTFTTGSGTLAQGSPYSGDITHVIGTDTLEGPKGDERITGQDPPGLSSCRVRCVMGTCRPRNPLERRCDVRGRDRRAGRVAGRSGQSPSAQIVNRS